MLKFLKETFSIDEARVSTTILVFIVSSIFALYLCNKNGDIPDNLLNFLLVQLGVIGGVNISGAISDIISKKK
ncbi:hypothetical protein [Paenibacillus elgii]|uniref:hypothetical protein n=1 Tax=Paenibacillus elgii TaxID=189691 RepID=UPI000248C652|nr:hypothetical protein [Paenibacillus elgii]